MYTSCSFVPAPIPRCFILVREIPNYFQLDHQTALDFVSAYQELGVYTNHAFDLG
jgi:hypothetical protein